MGYCRALDKMSLDAYKRLLEEDYLIPSLLMLRQDIDQVFSKLSDSNIQTAEGLYQALKTKKKAEILADQLGIEREYMIRLRRSISSYIPKSRKIGEYPCIESKLKQAILAQNIKNSKDLYNYLEQHKLEDLCHHFDVDKKTIVYLKQLMNLSRLRYASPIFVTVLIAAGYHTMDLIAKAEASELLAAFTKYNDQLDLYKGKLGENDMRFIIEDARMFMSLE
jgi:exonuclease VII large subunit